MVEIDSRDRLAVAIGAYVYGGLHLGALILIGIAWQSPLIALLALAATGIAYLVQVLQVFPAGLIPPAVIGWGWIASMTLGLVAGILAILAAF